MAAEPDGDGLLRIAGGHRALLWGSVETHFCPICGYERPGFVAYVGGDGWGTPTLAICRCCGVQFGYDDVWEMGRMPRIEWHAKMRQAWGAGGIRWNSPYPPPEGWDPAAQLERLRRRAQERGSGVRFETASTTLQQRGQSESVSACSFM